MEQFLGFILLAALVYAIYILQSRARRTRPLEGSTPFRKRAYLLTEAERSFFEVLCRSADSDTIVFPKVRLVDLLWLPRGTPNRQGLLNRVISKHVDFALCTRQGLSPVLVVELDDVSHSQEQRQIRDNIVDTILRDAQLPLLRIPAKRAYAPHELMEMITAKRGLPGERPIVEMRMLDGTDETSA